MAALRSQAWQVGSGPLALCISQGCRLERSREDKTNTGSTERGQGPRLGLDSRDALREMTPESHSELASGTVGPLARPPLCRGRGALGESTQTPPGRPTSSTHLQTLPRCNLSGPQFPHHKMGAVVPACLAPGTWGGKWVMPGKLPCTL